MPVDLPRADGYRRRPEGGSGLKHASRNGLGIGFAGPLPLFPSSRAGIGACGEGFADAGRTIADADMAVSAYRRGEFSESPVLVSPGHCASETPSGTLLRRFTVRHLYKTLDGPAWRRFL